RSIRGSSSPECGRFCAEPATVRKCRRSKSSLAICKSISCARRFGWHRNPFSFLRPNLRCCRCSLKGRTKFGPVMNCSTGFGVKISSAIRGSSMCMSAICARNWAMMPQIRCGWKPCEGWDTVGEAGKERRRAMNNGSAPKPSAEGTQSSSLAELTLRAVVDLSDDVLFFLGPEKQIRWMSQRAAQLTRVAKDSAVGQEITKLINSIGLDRAIERSLETGKVQRATVKIGADQLDMEARIIPIVVPSTSDGNVEAVVLSLAELEFEKRLQSMRREFVANVSHELRSPLTSILGYAETLLEDPPDDEEQRRRFLTAIVREARRMQRLVEDLLNLSRIESGRAAPQFEGVNLHNVVGRVLTQLRDQAERAG